ncbi:protein RGF1 INDUCIBLE TRANSCRIPTION FACTOR 1 isoform X2 [Oryza brachyantha]|uniref:protein RGF1 INDUCIBLE TRANSCRIPTION FACTOR 1 isoform X2 n=1 Tax=Oryza brachyantha TaxID=4533 RepID=UPI0007760581|nr:protein RGF1 INDUCIBLE TRANSCRIPTION FACTOR 1 isoform X2 [Oryza brachyantha]
MMMRRVAPPASGEEAEAEAEAGSSTMPDWLETLLSTRFFLACAAHPASPRNECNMFCLDCPRAPPSPAFCYYCRSHRHQAHRVIQIRRSSYHDVVRVSEVEDVLDISGVQTYVINSAKVLFLNERPQPRGAGAAAGKAAASPYNCKICARALLDPFRFCSLGCKLVDTKTGGRGGATAAAGDAGGVGNDEAGGSKSVGGAARPQGRRRKGIPQRAPFGS